MNDSDVEVNDLDTFSDAFFGNKPVEVKDESEVTETPSATEEVEADEAEAEVEESEQPEEADGDDTAAEDEPEVEDEDKSVFKTGRRKSVQERINELTRAAREAERERDALRQELDKRGETKASPNVTRQDTTPLDAGAPTPDDISEGGELKYPLGEFDPLYIRDLTRFTIRQETEAAKTAMEQERQQGEMERVERELLTSWGERLTTAAERLPDLSEKVVELEDSFSDLEPNYGKYLASTIMSLEYGPDVLNYLAHNPAEARKIVNSGATQATIALGRIEARFAGEVEREPVVTTQAPPPPPRNRGSGGKVNTPADTDDLDAFAKTFFK